MTLKFGQIKRKEKRQDFIHGYNSNHWWKFRDFGLRILKGIMSNKLEKKGYDLFILWMENKITSSIHTLRLRALHSQVT